MPANTARTTKISRTRRKGIMMVSRHARTVHVRVISADSSAFPVGSMLPPNVALCGGPASTTVDLARNLRPVRSSSKLGLHVEQLTMTPLVPSRHGNHNPTVKHYLKTLLSRWTEFNWVWIELQNTALPTTVHVARDSLLCLSINYCFL